MPARDDRTFMDMALDLAERGMGRTWPNPMVGAVLVKNGKVVGTGWHRRCGGPHAEVFALRQAGANAKGATLYVNLEPCSHFGKTPPCALALSAAGIKRVVCSMRDPNPKVSGRGFELLRQSGIRVETGLLGEKARRVNAVFIKRITTGMPFVVNKAALSVDGRIACSTGASRWISNLPARKYAHRLRSLADAVIVGMGTVRRDNPRLTPRLTSRIPAKRLIRVVLAGEHEVPARAAVFRPVPFCRTVLACSTDWKSRRLPSGVEVKVFPGRDGRVDLKRLVQWLGEEGASYVLVEGGAETHAGFLGLQHPGDALLSDQIQFIYAPKIIGGGESPGPVSGKGVEKPTEAIQLIDCQWRALGPDMLLSATPLGGLRQGRGRRRRA